ncbi:Ten1 domain containing protein [Pyrenophora tritici-repentis]|uniref:Ten1 domain containing protein n=1 Tax=Pyrenophora tritici-repentis TaxID=45151 RepID=A0A834S2D1_9PLEO|nr:Ten1 domain containing protein [Pyrenophora tritici-repentis]KAI0580898.1 Ten1 domain-containing protein [Pyrenophora tritici-repentis]KAI0584169.1 Ten1 domain-containing protein [Pyrenophora tritici-repentis]KAI0612520.1 Ten1 domain-containing protein [Pyrenophora tritici-repentis]KAI0622542.1 Ten1 domain-containing protein [Pyrenophora tritici-repentis]
MSSTPVASNLVLLRDLPTCPHGTKVRFLGCVDEYIVETATLRLKHDYPVSSPPLVANLNIEHVLDRVKRHEVDVGTWLNVIGYVQRRITDKEGVFVQALCIWDAGNLDLAAYSKAVEKRNEGARAGNLSL